MRGLCAIAASIGALTLLATGTSEAQPGQDCEPYRLDEPQTDPLRRELQSLLREIRRIVPSLSEPKLCEASDLPYPAGVDFNRNAIVYNPARLGARRAREGRNEVATVMIAHEVGHLALHRSRRPDAMAMELEADDFAGYVARRLGLATGLGARAYRIIVPGPANSQLRYARTAAFERGWDRGAPPPAEAAAAEAPTGEEEGSADAHAEETAANAGISATNRTGQPAASAGGEPAGERPGLLARILHAVGEASALIAGIGAAITALYGGYRWLRKVRRRRRIAEADRTAGSGGSGPGGPGTGASGAA